MEKQIEYEHNDEILQKNKVELKPASIQKPAQHFLGRFLLCVLQYIRYGDLLSPEF
jgi:hypothetical protein